MYLIFIICLFVHVHACAEMCYYRYLLYTIKKKSFQSLMSSQCAAMALQSCGWIPSCTLSNFPAFQAVCAVLTSLMIHHTETVLKVIPTSISCVNHILLQFKAYMWPQKMWLYRNPTDLFSNVFRYMYLLLWICSFSSNGDNLMKQQDLHIATYKFCNYSSEVLSYT